ncbi:MAG: carboxylesterase family protein, partial [Actinomycetota bacterium]
MTGPVVTTASGRVEGQVRDGVVRFLGIPYAAPPVGALRFAAPHPPAPWDGVRPATAFGPTPPSVGYRPPFDAILHQVSVPGQDWLTLNVWTPDPGAGGLAVMVWLYGGAFVNGSTATPMYDGAAFARDGVVLVTVNYRLGVDGFALLPGAPANRGLLDQVAALGWVRDNVAAFGGDPARVTVFGESAGAMSVVSLMAAPRTRGLFARAVTQSGAAQAAADPADAALVTAELGAALGREATAATLADLPIADLLRAQRQVSDTLTLRPDPARFGTSVVASSMAFIPVVDG